MPIPQEAGEGFEIQARSATVDLDIDPSFLSERYFVNILHILEESFSNIKKYANAKNVSMFLATREDDIYLAIVDDGDGFDLETAELGRGYGLPTSRTGASVWAECFTSKALPAPGSSWTSKFPCLFPRRGRHWGNL